MSIVVTRTLVCDWPECGISKKGLLWWESDEIGEGTWNHTKDNRDWCPNHTREQITKLLESEKQT